MRSSINNGNTKFHTNRTQRDYQETWTNSKPNNNKKKKPATKKDTTPRAKFSNKYAGKVVAAHIAEKAKQ
jgi:hypothetical protein